MLTPPPSTGGAVPASESVTLSLADARRLPPSNSPRLRCCFYSALPKTLPNGMPVTTPLVADALLELGGDFLIAARILRDGPNERPSRLEVGRAARDKVTGRIVLMAPYAPGVLRACYDMMAARQVLVNARQAAQKARN